MNANQMRVLRREKDEFFKTNAYSPLTPEQQDAFDHLNYYEPNEALDLTVTITPLPEGEIAFETTSGDRQRYRRAGEFTFSVEGQEARLTIYAGPNGYFLPFVDASAGSETYGAGRYIEPEPIGTHRFHVDFNLAYNPYCAYADGWSCPITPAENRLKVAIRAGEKLPEGEWVIKV